MKSNLVLSTFVAFGIFFASQVHAQINVENDDSVTNTATGTKETSAQITGFGMSGGDTLAILIAAEGDTNPPSYTVMYDGIAVTENLFVQEGNQGAAIFYMTGLSGTESGNIDVTFNDDSFHAVSAISLSGVAGISGSGTFGEPENSGSNPSPWDITYGGAENGYVLAAFADNDFDAGADLSIEGTHINNGGGTANYFQQIGGNATESVGRALAGNSIGSTGLATETFTEGGVADSSRNAGALLAFYPTGLTPQNLTWEGGASDEWDTFGTANWDNGSSSVAFQPIDTVEFNDDDLGVPTTVNITSSITPVSTTVDSDGLDFTFESNSNGIGGSGTLTKSGTSTLFINNGNSFSGGTILNAGIIALDDAGDVGSGAVTLNGTSEFHVGESTTNTILNAFVVNGSNVISNTSTPTQSLRLDGSLSGSGDLALENGAGAGVNALDLRADNTSFTGSITLDGNGGKLAVRGTVSGSFGTNVDWDTGLNNDLGISIDTNETITLGSLAGGENSSFFGRNNSGGANQRTLEIGSSNASSEFAGTIADTVSGNNNPANELAITKVGTGTLTLSGTNTYSGNTSVEAGTLSISEDYLADSADVYLTTGATLNLDFGFAGDFEGDNDVDGLDYLLWQRGGSPNLGSDADLAVWESDFGDPNATIDTIDSLFIDGISQATGTWGAIGSGADNETTLISGTGWLMVTTFVPPALATVAIPEPASLCLMALSGICLLVRRKRKTKTISF